MTERHAARQIERKLGLPSGLGADLLAQAKQDQEQARRDQMIRDAAPDLLAALIAVRDGAKNDEPALWRQIDAAIAKAEGTPTTAVTAQT